MDERLYKVGALAEIAGLTVEEVAAEQAAGTDPADARVLALFDRWQALIDQFTGGDPAMAESLKRMYRDEGPESASKQALSPEVADYMGAAFAARRA